MTENGSQALARLGVFVGEWGLGARFPGDQPTPSSAGEDGPQARSRFEWALDGQFLLQRTEVPVPRVPDSLSIVSADPGTGAYTQPGRERHQRHLGEAPQRRRLGARLRPHLPQGLLT